MMSSRGCGCGCGCGRFDGYCEKTWKLSREHDMSKFEKNGCARNAIFKPYVKISITHQM